MLRTFEEGIYTDLMLVLYVAIQAFDCPYVPVDGIVVAQFQLCAGVLLPNLRQLDFEPLRRLLMSSDNFSRVVEAVNRRHVHPAVTSPPSLFPDSATLRLTRSA